MNRWRRSCRLPAQLAIREQEGADVGARRQFQPAAFEQAQILVEPGEDALGVAAIGALDRFLEFSPAPAETNLEVS
jgi:hypothetical protein